MLKFFTFSLKNNRNNKNSKFKTKKNKTFYKSFYRRKLNSIYLLVSKVYKRHSKYFFILIFFVFLFFFFINNINNEEDNQKFDYEFIILSDNEITKSRIYEYLKDKELTKTSVDSKYISNVVLNHFQFSNNSIIVQKFNKNTFILEFLESTPELAVINLKSIFFINKNTEIVREYPIEDQIDLSEEEILLLRDKIQIDSDFVKIKYLGRFDSEEEKRKVNWQQISKDDKLQVLNEEKLNVRKKLNDFYDIQLSFIKNSEFPSIPVILTFSDLKEINFSLFQFITNLNKQLSLREILINKIFFYDENLLEILINDKKIFLFSIRRDIEEQLLDLDSVILSGLLNRFSLFDLRSRNFVVR